LKINDLKSIFKRVTNPNSSMLELLNTSSKVTIVRMLGLAASMLVSILLGRFLGVEGLGLINLGNQIINIITVIAVLGIPVVVLKEVSIANLDRDSNKSNSVIVSSLFLVLLAGILFTAGLVLFSKEIAVTLFDEPNLTVPLKILGIGISFQLIARVMGAGVNGLGKIWQSSLADKNMMTFLIILLLLLGFHLFGHELDVVAAASIFIFSRGLVALGITVYWHFLNPFSTSIDFKPKPLLLVGLPLLVANTTNVLTSSTDTLMLGFLSEVSEVGYYTVANRIAFSFSIFLPIMNSTIAPKIAPLYANGKKEEIESLVQKSTKILFLLGLGSLLVLLVFGKYILILWGQEFKEAYWMLLILGFGQFVSLSIGSVGLLLTLCNKEKLYGYVSITSAVLNVILNLFLINSFGGLGAAIATATTMILTNIAILVLVKRTLNIRTI